MYNFPPGPLSSFQANNITNREEDSSSTVLPRWWIKDRNTTNMTLLVSGGMHQNYWFEIYLYTRSIVTALTLII